MIEIIYNNSGKKSETVIVKPPKNIRQIGSPRGRHKIYIEDYVYTYLHSVLFEGGGEKKVAVLIGKSESSQDIRYSFISGAVNCEDFVFQQNDILFDESCWEYIYKEIKQYFDQQEVIGWFISMSGFPLEITPAIESAHRKYFTGREKIVFLSDPSEQEDVFYAYEQGHLQKKEGYYIYYEKNLPMQEYMVSSREKAREENNELEDHMIENNLELEKTNVHMDLTKMINQGSIRIDPKNEREQEITVDVDVVQHSDISEEEEKSFADGIEAEMEKSAAEEALQSYRAMLLEKKDHGIQKKMSVLLYTAASVVLVVLCVIGITTINNYEKMKDVEATLSLISDSVDEEQSEVAKKEDETNGLVVETVSGDVKPETDETKVPDNNSEAEVQENDDSVTEESTQSNQTENGEILDTSTENSENNDEKNTDQETDQDSNKAEDDQNNDSEDTVQTMAQTYLEQGYYIVQPGDKLELICKYIYQTTAVLDKVCELNEIEDVDKIYAGQKIMLP